MTLSQDATVGRSGGTQQTMLAILPQRGRQKMPELFQGVSAGQSAQVRLHCLQAEPR